MIQLFTPYKILPMNKIHTIDLDFLNNSQTVAAFLVESDEGPVLIETGPESTWTQLEKGINALGYRTKDIKHVLLSHIHLDHAGAAWKFAETGALIHVHPLGLPHLESPGRLWNSAQQIYGDDMQRLWGQMEPIPKTHLTESLHGQPVSIGNIEFIPLHTPGHAMHHISWQLEDNIFTGDVAGVKINNGPVVPPCPPPDINIEKWKSSIALLKGRNAKTLYLTHFGEITEPSTHLTDLELMLDDWANWMKPYYENPIDQKEITKRFMSYTGEQLVAKGVNHEDRQRYEHANPSWMSVAGLLRYWKLKDQGRI